MGAGLGGEDWAVEKAGSEGGLGAEMAVAGRVGEGLWQNITSKSQSRHLKTPMLTPVQQNISFAWKPSDNLARTTSLTIRVWEFCGEVMLHIRTQAINDE